MISIIVDNLEWILLGIVLSGVLIVGAAMGKCARELARDVSKIDKASRDELQW